MQKRPHLLFCMTPGVGLRTWERLGTLERELKPYVDYMARGWRVTILTYDRVGDAPRIPAGFEVAYIQRPLLPFAAILLRRLLADVDVVKTNQSGYSWWYVLAARLNSRPIILRCGWLPGAYRARSNGVTTRLRVYRLLEGWSFRHANACQVATEADKKWACQHYRVQPKKIHLRPNFIDHDLFQPDPSVPPIPRSVVFVGRLNRVKRVDLLIEACAKAEVSVLTVVGTGELHQELEAHARKAGVRVVFAGSVPQQQLPAILRQSEVFALTSTVEGHPKALLEAMACGLPCVGVRSPGIAEVIDSGVNGLLTDEDSDSVGSALRQLFDDEALRKRMGTAARDLIVSTLDFRTIMNNEMDLVLQTSQLLSATTQPSLLEVSH